MSSELELMKLNVCLCSFDISCYSSNEVNIEYKTSKNYQFIPRSWQNEGWGKSPDK